MDLVTYDDYDRLSEQMRRYCAQKFMELEANLVSYVNGDFGDVQPAHVQAYVAVIKELGRLYNAQKPPRDPEAMLPASKVQQLLEAAEARTAAAVAEAIHATEQRLRQELALEQASSLELAKAQVQERLNQIRG